MNPQQPRFLTIGEWRLDRQIGELAREGETQRLEMRLLAVLLYLVERPGRVVGIDELLDHVWADVIVTPDSVYQAIKSLRKALGDDSRKPAYIATIPKLGYKFIGDVIPGDGGVAPPAEKPVAVSAVSPQQKRARLIVFGGLLALALLTAFMAKIFGITPVHPPTIAVMPLLDLTNAMDEEPFADGVTVRLIDRLSSLPGLKVAPRSAVFLYKDKTPSPADVGRDLGVAFVLEGSVHKDAEILRVTLQMVRVDQGFVVWSQNYDRPVSHLLSIQDEIADDVRGAVAMSMKAK